MTDKPAGAASDALEVFAVFLRLGVLAFGGPVAHIAYFRREFVERGFGALERAGVVGDMVGVERDEIIGHFRDVIGGADAAFRFQRALDHGARAGTDHFPCRRKRYGRQAFALQHEIQCIDEIRRAVHQRAVEIENNKGKSAHIRSLPRACRWRKGDKNP